MMLVCDFAVVALNPDLKSTGAPLPCRTAPVATPFPFCLPLPAHTHLRARLGGSCHHRQCATTNVLRARFLWQIHYGVGLGIAALFVAARFLRHHLLLQVLSYAAAMACSPSCKQPRTRESSSSPEKERLDYERKFAIKAKHAAGIGALGGVVLRMLAEEDMPLAAKWTITQSAARVARTAKKRCPKWGKRRVRERWHRQEHRTSRSSAGAARAKRADGADGGGGVGTRRTQTGNSCGEANATAIFTSTMSHLRPRSERVRPTSAHRQQYYLQ